MTDKLSCNIVQDLLPMYVDGLLTPESQSEVKKHLEECETCRELCAQLSEPEPKMQEDSREIDFLKKVRRRQIKLLISAAVTVACVAAGLLFSFHAQAGKNTVNYDEASQTIVVYGKEGDVHLSLPETTNQARNLDAQFESFRLSSELSLLNTDGQPLNEYLSAYLNRTNQSLQFIRSYLKKHCSDQYPAERAAKYVDISILSGGDYAWSELEDRIMLNMGNYYWHREELYLLSLLGGKTTEWKQLGYAWYLGSCVDPYSEVIATTNMDRLDSQVAEMYKRGGGTNEKIPENYRILNDAVACVCLTKGMNWGTAYESMPLKKTALYRGPKKAIDPGNEMSVCMATSFIAYLSDRYGFEKVSAFCFGQGRFESFFQTDYESAYSAWSDWILSTYRG